MTAGDAGNSGEAGDDRRGDVPAGVRGDVPAGVLKVWRWLRRPVVADILVTALSLFLSLTSSLQNPLLGPADTPWMNHVLAALVPLPLLVRRRVPEVAALVALAGYAAHAAVFTTLFAFYAVGAYRGPRNRLLTWGTAAVGLVVLAPWSSLPSLGLSELMRWLLFNFPLQVLTPLLVGLYVGARRAVMAGLVERAERAEREQLLIAEAARVEERTRIAGEMHDVVSHQVSLMVVHANALEAMAHDPDTTAQAAVTIRTAGRQALNELREMIGVLRRTPDEDGGPRDGGSVPGASGDGTAGGTVYGEGAYGERAEDQRPQPGLDQIPALVDSSRSAGLPVELTVEGERRPLPDAAERAAYRVVQEALTNVHKHAAGAATEVRLDYGAGGLSVSVVNSRPRPGGSTADGDGPLLPSGGHGLIGLGERVRLAGGTIESGPRPDGGFRVAIALPHTAEEPAGRT